jgi:septal ring factor EnvC (AmiA/AmiB activator)
LGLLLVVGAVGVTQSASASPVEDKRQEAQRIAAQIEALNNQSFDLGEEYDRVETELAEVDAEVAVAQKRVAELEAQLADGDLYDGSPEKAKQAAKLDQELAKARKQLDAAMASWAEATDGV